MQCCVTIYKFTDASGESTASIVRAGEQTKQEASRALLIQAEGSSETSVNICRGTRRHIPEDTTLSFPLGTDEMTNGL